MRINNFIQLQCWRIDRDNFGSKHEVLDDEIVAVKFRKAGNGKNDKYKFCHVRLSPNNAFVSAVFNIPESRGICITYKCSVPSFLIVEEKGDTYNCYYELTPSAEWKTCEIGFDAFNNSYEAGKKPDLGSITGFLISFDTVNNEEINGELFVSEFSIQGYEFVIMNDQKPYTVYLTRTGADGQLETLPQTRANTGLVITEPDGEPLYCLYPFTRYVIGLNYLSVCCWTLPERGFDLAQGHSLKTVWLSESFNRIRAQMKDLSFADCNIRNCAEMLTRPDNCFMTLSKIRETYPDIADYLEGRVKQFHGMPKHIEVAFDNTCNLRCRSCSAHVFDNHVSGYLKKYGTGYIDEIGRIGGNVESMTIAGYGDPFASPLYRNWLNRFSDKEYPRLKEIEILSNGILWNRENWQKVSEVVKKYRITGVISVDGATKEVYELNRTGGRFEQLIENLIYLSSLRKQKEIAWLTINNVVQQNNYHQIPLMIDFARKYSFDRIRFFKIVNWGSYSKEEFEEVNISDKKHPEHEEFCETCQKAKERTYPDLKVEFGF